MEWENKRVLIELGNNQDESIQAKEEFHKYILNNIESFDAQAWDMFSNLINLIPNEMKSDIDFWRKMYPYVRDLNVNNDALGLRAALRIAMMQSICEEELNLKE